MENKNIVVLKHHPRDLKKNNPFYLHQVDDDLSEYIVIDVTSRVIRDKEFIKEHPNFEKDLSPFYIGPVISSDGVKANIFEIFWQCGKVYPPHDDNGQPNKEFFIWRNGFYEQEKVTKSLMRHACEDLGYKNSDCLYFAYFDKDKKQYIPLNYVEARKRVYIKEYVKLIYNSESFKWLQSLVNQGKKIALLDFDGFNYYSETAMKKRYASYINKCKENKWPIILKEEDFLNIKTIKDAVNCSFMPVGHGFAIKMLLEGDIKVVNNEVVDNNHLLD